MMRNPFKIHEFYQVVSDSGLHQDHVILDLGCGKGFQTQVLARSCKRAVGLDVSNVQITEARKFLKHSCVEKKVEFLASRLEEAHLPSEEFDRVFSFCVLEHIPNLPRVLEELIRVMKPGGELHASVDALTSIKNLDLMESHKRDHYVVQYFTTSSLRQQLEDAGFEVLEVFPIMTGDFAREQFEIRIQRTDFSYGLMDRLRFYRRLRDEDLQSQNDEGIMIVVRARRPKEVGKR